MTVKQLFTKKIKDFAKRNSTDPKHLHKPKKLLFNIWTISTTWYNLGVLIKQVQVLDLEVLELNMCAWLKQNQKQFYFLYCKEPSWPYVTVIHMAILFQALVRRWQFVRSFCASGSHLGSDQHIQTTLLW